jgi:hypothetical protein
MSKKTLEPMGAAPLVVRHYCQGIGDCHLLKFIKEDGSDYWILIDCGLHSSVSGSYDTMDRVVADIVVTTGGKIDLLIVTHEHWDHVSGFLTAREHFENLEVAQVWMAWTENPAEPAAVTLDKYKDAAQVLSQRITFRLGNDSSSSASALRSGLEALSGFHFGAKGEKVRSARNAAKALSVAPVRYLEPSSSPISVEELPQLRIYVLGPPRDEGHLKLTDRKSERYGAAESRISAALAAAPGLEPEEDHRNDAYGPFDPEIGYSLKDAIAAVNGGIDGDVDPAVVEFMSEHYVGKPPLLKEKGKRKTTAANARHWRRIDDDWLGASADLAMQLDSRTNNTSLVLAFEFAATGRVALFAADAQVGNWLSWHTLSWQVGTETVTADDLLRRTVYYKVSHHGSENATLREKGLERMTHSDLSAFIPTNEKDAAKVGWHQMPFDLMLQVLKEKTSGRVIRADDPWVHDAEEAPPAPSGSIKSVERKLGLYVELGIE